MTASSSSDSPASRKRKVGFGDIQVIEFAYSLGDNPSCSGGSPVSICGGDELERIDFQVDYYEKHRPRRRTKRGLLLSKRKRASL
jgi:hypothetical protein